MSKSERNPKLEIRIASADEIQPSSADAFAFGNSEFGLLSVFGFRHSDLHQ